jgi:hypothetical protein
LALPRLERLSLAVNPIGEGGLTRLAAAPYAQTLRDLDLSGCQLQGADLSSLKAGSFPNLERLSLRGNPLGQVDFRHLLRPDVLPRLQHLDLRATHRGLPRSGYGNEDQSPPQELCQRLGDGLLW